MSKKISIENKKKCSACKKYFPATLEFFCKNKRRKDNLNEYCKNCSIKKFKKWFKINREKLYQKRKKKLKNKLFYTNKCRSCSNKRLKNSKNWCEDHWYKKVSYDNLGSSKFWKKLKDMAIRQNYTCPYTEEKLIPALNMSLDHIKSKFNNLTLKDNIKNVQWVTKDINLIKNKLSHKEFLDLCKKIYKKFC